MIPITPEALSELISLVAQRQVQKRLVETLPWENSKEWNPKFWYPLPCVTEIKFHGEELEIEGGSWDCFFLDPEHLNRDDPLFGDIDCIGFNLTFLDAVRACNAHNGVNLWVDVSSKEKWLKP